MLDPLSSISASPDCSHAGHNGQEISLLFAQMLRSCTSLPTAPYEVGSTARSLESARRSKNSVDNTRISRKSRERCHTSQNIWWRTCRNKIINNNKYIKFSHLPLPFRS